MIRLQHRRFRAARLGGSVVAIGLLAGATAGAVDAQLVQQFRFQSLPQVEVPVRDLDLDEEPRPQAIAAADVNGDGDTDLVVINQFDDQVVVLLGDGSGELAFDEGLAFDLFNGTPAAVAVADVSSVAGLPDGNPDVIVATLDGAAELLLGDGTGTFISDDEFVQDLSELIDEEGLVALAVADFDANGLPDLAFLDTSEQVFFLCNEGGNLVPCPTFVASTDGAGPVDLAAGDFDGDGLQDVAALNLGSRNVSVIYGAGDGEFSPTPLLVAATAVDTNEPRALAAAPIDDGATDDLVVVNDEAFDSLGIVALFGFGRRFERQIFTVDFFSNDVALADLNADGAIDALMSSDNPDGSPPSLLPGVAGSFDQNLFVPAGLSNLSRGLAIALDDVGGDALADVIQLQASGEAIRVAINRSNEPTPTPTATPSPLPTETSTPGRRSDEDDGCAVAAGSGMPAVELLVFLGALLLARGRGVRAPR